MRGSKSITTTRRKRKPEVLPDSVDDDKSTNSGTYDASPNKSNNQSSSSTYTGTVEGQGRSTYNPNKSYKTYNAEFREVVENSISVVRNSSSTSAGKSFIDNLMKSFNPGIESSNQLLLEDKH